MEKPWMSIKEFLARFQGQDDRDRCKLVDLHLNKYAEYSLARCGTQQPPFEVAHIVPWPAGPTEEANLTLLCKPCNGSDRRGWDALPRPRGYDLPQTKAAFDAIVNRVLARVLP